MAELKHYEIVILVRSDGGERIQELQNTYETMIKNGGGIVHRYENWGRRHLSYPIKKKFAAYYLLFNVEIATNVLQDLKDSFRYNDVILRTLILNRDEAITEPSAMLLAIQATDNQESNQSATLVTDR